MRIICLVVAFSGFEAAAFALSPSRLEHWHQYESRQRQGAVGVASLRQSSARSSDAAATVNKPSMSAVDFNASKEKYHTSKSYSVGIPTVYFRTILATLVLSATVVGPVFADEYGVEKEAPTLFTGETVEICTKRGPLGACLKTEMRTAENDNDVAKKYFRDPSTIVQQQKVAVLQKSDQDNDDGNELIQKLRQQSVDNREKNDLYVARKTFEADQSATFGPFDRQVLIMNTDGKTYTLLENPVAMRLKKAGFIDNRRSFITQPSQEDLDAASEKEPGFFSNFLGGGSN